MRTVIDAIWLAFVVLVVAIAWPWLKDEDED